MVHIPDDADFNSFREQCESNEGWQCQYNKGGVTVWSQEQDSVKTVKKLKIRDHASDVSKCHFLYLARETASAECRFCVPNTGTGTLQYHIQHYQMRIICKDVSAEVLYDVLHDTSYRRKWDTNMIDTFDIGRLTVNADVGYYSWKCPSPLKNRDFVTLRSWLPLGNDYMIINYSVKHPKHPPRKDFVRAVSLQTGYLIKANGENSCVLYYLTQVDPKGSLPKWVVNKVSQFVAPKAMKKIYKAGLKYPEWKRKHDPHFKPWVYPEQNTLPTVNLEDLAIQRADELENIDESGVSEERTHISDDEDGLSKDS